MTVYADPIRRFPVAGKSSQVQRVFGAGSCHMTTDQEDLAELHRMATKIGLRRAWFQDKPGFPHYDLNASRRAAAVRSGAVEVETEELVRMRRQLEASRAR